MLWPTSRNGIIHWLLIVAAFVAVLSTVLLTKHNYSGDEPHYLVMTYSLIKDHDLDLKNDYQTGRYLSYYPIHIDPHVGGGHEPQGYPHWYSIHGPGLPFLLALPVAFFGIRGAIGTMGLVGIFTLVLLYLWTKRVTGRRLAGWAAVIMLASSVFFTGLVGYIYPDLPIAALLLAALLLVTKRKPKWWHWLLLGFVLGGATWFHFKNMLTFTPLGIYALWVIWKQRLVWKQKLVSSAALLAPWASLNILFEIKLHQWFNVWVPSQIYPPSAQLLQTSPTVTLPAMLFDAGKGLLSTNPAFWIILLGLPLWYLRKKSLLGVSLLAVLPFVLLLATFSDWTGGYAPSGRYLMEFAPMLLPAVGFVAVSKERLIKLLAILLVIIQLGMTVLWVRIKAPIFDSYHPNPLTAEVKRVTGIEYSAYWPHYEITKLHSAGDLPLVWLDIALAASVIGTGVMIGRKKTN